MAKTLIGKVASTKMQQTVSVKVERSYRHPVYKKTIKRHKKFLAHINDDMKVEEGDTVEITETRPLSKNKHFIVTKKIS